MVYIMEQKWPLVIAPHTQEPLKIKKKSQVGSLCNEEHPVCSYMFSKEVAVKNEALQVLLYILHYS